MLEAIFTAIKFDEILIGLAGHVANDASAKMFVSAIKALGPALLGMIPGAEDRQRVTKRRVTKRRKQRRKARSTKCSCSQRRR